MSRTDARTANLLGALATTLAAQAGTASDDAALITLDNYAEGQPLDLLRGALGLSHPATVRLADRLQARGLVERRRAGDDGRSVGLCLTATGRAAAAAARQARAEALEPTLAVLRPSERRTLAALMDKVLAAQTTSSERSRWICRLCDPDACGHPRRCPVTRAAMALGP
jgi:MarR family transcriptional regulator, negative regulator of the multidrug operon emrRAB